MTFGAPGIRGRDSFRQKWYSWFVSYWYGNPPSFPSKRSPIICNLTPGHNGWRVNVFMPHRVNPHDRVKVIQWLGDYQAQIRRNLPDTMVSFRQPSPDQYSLDIRIMERSGSVHKVQAEKLDHLWQQLTFDYA